MASPRYWELSAVDASREGDEECLILIHPQQREGRGWGLFHEALILWTAHKPVGPASSLSGIWVRCCIGRDGRSLFQICPWVPSLRLLAYQNGSIAYAIEARLRFSSGHLLIFCPSLILIGWKGSVNIQRLKKKLAKQWRIFVHLATNRFTVTLLKNK